ncbi:alpha/beta fold hydrolase [Pedomonas mirosovicensis]|uniref:alpha/beta fold hydrolase n=1 Tax=Pedomonas mirosovicensis TaxID=2908641 RepID=UPI002166E36A|nr:alpha/beta hydrolase [Pedomonas mirosovicensis]MCH8683972.1 alpha/beta hydrolase [Pedomonas mirosovicensis]
MPELANATGGRLVFDDEGAGRPLLLVHGWATHAGFFAPQRQALAREFRVISLDLAGHGRSNAPDAPLTLDHLAGDILALCRHLALENAVAVGWSMGAMAVWAALLAGAGAHITGHVVVDMSPRILSGPGWALGMKNSPAARTEKAMRAGWPGLAPRIARRLFAHGLEAERRPLRQWAEAEIAAADGAVMASLWASMLAQDFRGALPGMATPTLIAHGALSQLYAPETAAFLAASLPRAGLHGFSRSGHAPHLEEPDAFNRMVADFARQGTGRAATATSAQSQNKRIKGRTL